LGTRSAFEIGNATSVFDKGHEVRFGLKHDPRVWYEVCISGLVFSNF